MKLGKSSIDYMSRVHGIAQRMHRGTSDHIIPLYTIASLYHKRYPGVKSRYLAGDTALVNCDLLQLSRLLSSEEKRQQTLGITPPPSTTSVNWVPHNNSQNEGPIPSQHQPTTPSSNVPYSPSRGVTWKCIALMVREEKSCRGCHFNHPKDSPKLKVYQEVGYPALVKHDYLCQKYVTASAKI